MTEPEQEVPEVTEGGIPEPVKQAINDILNRYRAAETDEDRDKVKQELVIEMGKTFVEGYQYGFRDAMANVQKQSKIFVPNRAVRRHPRG